jgi:protein involved in polysaccharide export with SLBB domain
MKAMLRTAKRNSGKDSIDISMLATMTTYPVAIELDKALQKPHSDDDPVLREGDRIIVPKYTSTVTINGEVLYPNTVRYMAGKDADYYIDLAGGATSNAKKRKAIIVYMNGMVAKASSKNKPRPGCQIVVPTKKEHRQLSTPEILSMGSSIASLGSIIASIVHLTK